MREFEQLNDAIPISQRHIQQIIASWLGLTGTGTDADLAGVPLRQTAVNDDALYAVDARNRGAGGLHYRATHSSGAPVLFQVTDSGVLASVSGGVATNPFVYSNMVVGWNGTAASIPSGWTVITAAKARVIYGADVDGDVGDTGGAATYDISHNHTQNSHNHTQDTHNHTQNVHSHSHSHTYSVDHNHPDVTSDAAQDGVVDSFETGDPLAGSALEYATEPHTHTVDIPDFDTTDRTTVADATNATATNQTTVATNQATTATNQSGGSAVQSVLNPFIRYYHIQRT